MIPSKYFKLFPKTMNITNFEEPYNNKNLRKQSMHLKKHKKIEINKIKKNLRNLKDFSLENPDLHHLLIEAVETLRIATDAYGSSIYIVNRNTNEISLMTEENSSEVYIKKEYVIEEGTIISAHVAYHKENVMVENIKNDTRFPLGIGQESNIDIGSVMCVPLVLLDGECIAVLEFFRLKNEKSFEKNDLKIIIIMVGWMGATIHQNLQRTNILKQEYINDILLNITISYFQKNTNTIEMITDFMLFAKDVIGAKHANFYFINVESEDKFAEVYEESIENNKFIKKNLKINLDKNYHGVVSIVARTGKKLNIKNCDKFENINMEPEQKRGILLKNILCMPIYGIAGIIGIIRLVNKKKGSFEETDEKILRIFERYIASCLLFKILKNNLKRETIMEEIYLKLLKSQLRPCCHDYDTCTGTIHINMPHKFADFRWYIPIEYFDITPQLTIQMIIDICDDGEIVADNLINFILTVKKLYRDNPYHNFEHAFCFLHCMYCILKKNLENFTSLERKALMVASICHDIDHGGFTNHFLSVTNDILYQLYPESTWENYHYITTVNLLKLFPVFGNLNGSDHKLLLGEIKDAIISTDLQIFFKNRLKLLPVINQNSFELKNNSHKNLCKTIMMTVCDLSGQCMPYDIASRVTNNVYREFYHQGDLEKKLGLSALSMMDRDKHKQIPEDQVHFLSYVVQPALEILVFIFPNILELYTECIALQGKWQDIITSREKTYKKSF